MIYAVHTRDMAHIPERDDEGRLPGFAWPGGYPFFYITQDNGALCRFCANGGRGSEATTEATEDADPQWLIVASDINYEDPVLLCDHCQRRIESAYAEDHEDAVPLRLGEEFHDSAMQPEIVEGSWHVVTSDSGDSVFPADLFSVKQAMDQADGEVTAFETVKGFGARLQMPGYMDSTEWTVLPTWKEAALHLIETYGPEMQYAEEWQALGGDSDGSS